jgi:hypothetical protein
MAVLDRLHDGDDHGSARRTQRVSRDVRLDGNAHPASTGCLTYPPDDQPARHFAGR